MLTILLTTLKKDGLLLLASNEDEHNKKPATRLLFATQEFMRTHKTLKPSKDRQTAMAKTDNIATHGLQVCVGMNWCGRLTGRDGLFEVIKNGVRFYGGVAGTFGGVEIVGLFGAEQKGGNTKADNRILDACETEKAKLTARCQQIVDGTTTKGGVTR